MRLTRFVSAFLVLAAACSKAEAPGPASGTAAPASTASAARITTMPKFDAAPLLDRIKALSADEFEGRAPSTKGEELTVTEVEGRDALHEALAEGLDSVGCTLRWRELDPDIFGEELEKPAYAEVERIAAIGAVVEKPA